MSITYGIPLYNKAQHIGRVLEAAIAECARTGGEVIVYDDGSTDDSVEIVRRYAAEVSVRLIEGGRNLGVFAATERLIQEARQPLLRLVDGDDEIVACSTERLAAMLALHGAVLAVGSCVSRAEAESGPEDPCGLGPACPLGSKDSALVPHPFQLYARGVRFNLSGALMRTDSAKAILPMPTGLRIAQDICVTLRLARLGPVVHSHATVSIQPDEPENRLSRRMAAMYRDICLILSNELGQGCTPPEAASVVRRQAARCLRYFRREAPRSLTPEQRLALYRFRLTSPTCSLPTAIDRLRRIADTYASDVQRVLARTG